MAKRKTKIKKTPREKPKLPSFKLSSQHKLIFGSFLVLFGILLFIAFVSFFFTGKADQSTLSEFLSRSTKAENWLSKTGAWLSDLIIYRGFGVASFIFSGLIFLSGVYVLMDINKSKLRKHWFWGTLIVLWISVLFGFFSHTNDVLGGTVGYEINTFLQDYIGKIGLVLLLLFGFITYLAIRFKVTFESFTKLFKSAKKNIADDFSEINDDNFVPIDNNLSDEAEAIKSAYELNLYDTPTSPSPKKELKDQTIDAALKVNVAEDDSYDEIEITVEHVEEESSETDNLANKLVEDFGLYDPTLELGNYQFPHLDLLKK